MATARGGTTSAAARDDARSIPQWFDLVVGATLVLVGILGFFAEAKFDTSSGGDPGAVDGEDFLIFEVNGWHNVVHILSGLFLLVMSRRHESARVGALAFGAIYGVVTVIGLIDGHDVLGVIPVDPADNVLHIVLTLSAFAAALVPDRRDRTVATGPRTQHRTAADEPAARAR
jgi:hypothetical protein